MKWVINHQLMQHTTQAIHIVEHTEMPNMYLDHYQNVTLTPDHDILVNVITTQLQPGSHQRIRATTEIESSTESHQIINIDDQREQRTDKST